MDMSSSTRPNRGLPEGCTAIPIHRAEPETPLRVCVLVRSTPDPVEGCFYLIRDLPDARVFLGCVIDRGGHVKGWLELWVQNVDGLAGSLSAYRDNLNNVFLDKRWTAHWRIFSELAPESVLETGWEAQHPLPTFIDPASATPLHPQDTAKGSYWQLCRDDALLQASDLPPFSSSLYRYLYQPELGKESRFISVVADAPESARNQPLALALASKSAVAFNPQGGLMQVSEYYPLGFEEYVASLGQKPGEGLLSKGRPAPFPAVYQHLEGNGRTAALGAHLFLGTHGRAGRLVEIFQLKLQLLAECFSLVRSYVQKVQLPLLNVSADSFRVKLADIGGGLPLLWTTKCALVRPGQGLALPLKTTDQRYFIRAGNVDPSIYQPEGLSSPIQGQGTVRIRKVLPPERDGIVMEGTLVMPEATYLSPRDLLWMRLPVLASRIDLYGHAYVAESLAKGETRFRTVPQKLPDAVVVALKAAEGVPYARCTYEIAPLLSTPCDLYALGVLAIRTLLVNEKNSLAVALDEILSLAREAGVGYKAEVPLAARLRTLFEADARWLASLGPHHLTNEPITPEEASQWLPPRLWFDTLAALIRLFPGVGPDSVCRDLGDAQPLALETIFDPPMADWQKLLVLSRSLIAIDWNFNREVHSVIEGLRR
jgi:hypothetical protein